jgi:hypothetical protein
MNHHARFVLPLATTLLCAFVSGGCYGEVSGTVDGLPDGGVGSGGGTVVAEPTVGDGGTWMTASGQADGGPTGSGDAGTGTTAPGAVYTGVALPCGDSCVAAGGACEEGFCVLDADGQGGGGFCPPGVPCTILCSGTQSCSRVQCRGPHCRIVCSGIQSCEDVECSGGECEFVCSGSQSCLGRIECNAASCAFRCSGTQSCRPSSGNLTTNDCTAACSGDQSCNQSFFGDACLEQCTGTQSCL